MPFGADTLVIPFTFVGSRAPVRASGMSRTRPRSTYQITPPGERAPAGSVAPIRMPRTAWVPPPSRAHTDGGGAARPLLVSDHGTEREREEIERELPAVVPGLQPPHGHHASPIEPPPEPIHIPLLGGVGRVPPRAVPVPPGAAGTEDEAARQSRATLRRAMEGASLLKPNDPRQSHHLVPQGGAMNGNRDPELAQRGLKRWGIDIDSALNGVPLSRAFHARIHTLTYYRLIEALMLNATSRSEVERELNKLRTALVEADQAFQQTGRMPNWITGDTP